jgi:hypothetical protein
MRGNPERAALIARFRELVSKQIELTRPFKTEAKSWELGGLELADGFGLAVADHSETFERIRSLGDEILTVLGELEHLDSSGSGPAGETVDRVRWALWLEP